MARLLHPELPQVFPDPNVGTNNSRTPDIYDTGPQVFTLWWHNSFVPPAECTQAPAGAQQAWLELDGINYSVQVPLWGACICGTWQLVCSQAGADLPLSGIVPVLSRRIWSLLHADRLCWLRRTWTGGAFPAQRRGCTCSAG